ncbi:uncharacterized protein C8Q71DRAFT_385567 [Rhodofomes roseus]|uniref:Uncharacterized protein n=1 Tax=Rhodofomes roseus TaxID=34475 RepID=A0ABQ8K021_9APHY|nr:uncharacterized protein C8Q71DRAFT_385567 [Rhodofomes roseus]KAH9829992.1 hypothetical protein C8Q71DRAFT_385567 [Rhodofomes roseus]
MCYHLITFTEGGCNHRWATKRHYIDCNMTVCRLSQRHSSETHKCPAECIDMNLPDQSICLYQQPGLCYTCRGLETPRMKNYDSEDDEYDSENDE